MQDKLLKDKVINTEKNSIKIELRLAKEYLDQDKDAELKSLATDLKKRKLSKLDNEFLNALVAFSENNLISAITILSQLLVDNEANVEALKLLAEVYIADDNYFEASAAYEDLNKLTKNSYLLEFCQAIVLNSLNADGEKFCLQAATQYPNNPFPIIFIGISQRERGDLRRAILSFKKAVALKSTEMGHTCLAEAYFLKENYDLAIEQFKKSIELSQYSQRAVLGLAWAYLKKKNYTDSLATFKRACKMNSKTVIEIRKAFKELNLEKNPEDKNFIKLIEACGG
ncbi:MAG: tetratricopeptide repeat protein [Bdellovibrionota bacterium]